MHYFYMLVIFGYISETFQDLVKGEGLQLEMTNK